MFLEALWGLRLPRPVGKIGGPSDHGVPATEGQTRLPGGLATAGAPLSSPSSTLPYWGAATLPHALLPLAKGLVFCHLDTDFSVISLVGDPLCWVVTGRKSRWEEVFGVVESLDAT